MENLFAEGVTLLIFGMGFVFVFLTLLVVVTTLMSKVVMKYQPESTPAPEGANTPVQTVVANGQLIAVITAAIARHRASHGDHADHRK